MCAQRGEDVGFGDALEGGEEVDCVGLGELFEGEVDEGFDGLCGRVMSLFSCRCKMDEDVLLM